MINKNNNNQFDNKTGEKDAMDKKTLVFGIVAIVAILVIALAFFGTVMNNTSSDLQGTNQVSSSSGDNAAVSSSVNNSSEKVTGSSNAKSGTVFWASVKTNSFHKPSCEWAQKISDDNKIVFHSRQDALNFGRQPCEVCNP